MRCTLYAPQNVLWPNHVQFKHRTIQRNFARSLDDPRWFQSIFLPRAFSPLVLEDSTTLPIAIPTSHTISINPLEIREWVLGLGLCGFPTRVPSPISWNLQLPSTSTKKVDVLHLCRALESSNASIYIDLSQTPVSNTGTLAAVDWQLWFSVFFGANVEQWKKLVGFFSELFEVDWSNTNGYTHEQK